MAGSRRVGDLGRKSLKVRDQRSQRHQSGEASTSCFPSNGSQVLVKHEGKGILAKRLGEKIIHSTLQTFCDIGRLHIRRQGDDRHMRKSLIEMKPPDLSGGLETIHDRHVTIHQNQPIVGIRSHFDGLSAISCHIRRQTELTEDQTGDGLVDPIVLHDQNTAIESFDLFQ